MSTTQSRRRRLPAQQVRRPQNRTDDIACTRMVPTTPPEGALAAYAVVHESYGRQTSIFGTVHATRRDRWHASSPALHDVPPIVYKTRREAAQAVLYPFSKAASGWTVQAVELAPGGNLVAATLVSSAQAARLVHPEAVTRLLANEGTDGLGRMVAGTIAEMFLQAAMPREERAGRQQQNALSTGLEALRQVGKDAQAKALVKGRKLTP